MGAHLGESGRCSFTEQTDRKLVRIVADTSASTEPSLRVNPCPLGRDLLREPLSAAAKTVREHVQRLEPSGALTCFEID